ncbi:MAG: hypothetical protein ACI81P_001020 [Neolewinella sp.]|jgi:hypothetical protein
MHFSYFPTLLFVLLGLTGCAVKPSTYDFPYPVDTATRPIKMQEKKAYEFPALGLTFDNLFDGARLVELNGIEGHQFEAMILPENAPINPSPWYAFRISAEKDVHFTVLLNYGTARHRYDPKISTDLENWRPLPLDSITYRGDSTGVFLNLSLKAGDRIYLAGQEVINSSHVGAWLRGLAQTPGVTYAEAGKSRLKRAIPYLDVHRGDPMGRETIVLFSRQHPPEVTGFLALKGFIDGMLNYEKTDEFLKRYRVLIYPLINPDGVDLGHWRHNTGGVDLNRDWAEYRQPETRAVSGHVVRAVKGEKGDVILGMDFHSTYYDVYYTPDETVTTKMPGYKDAWLAEVERRIGGAFRVNDQARPIGAPTTAGWFNTQFGAVGITYEIGDRTERDFVKRKGQLSAEAMIDLLLAR